MTLLINPNTFETGDFTSAKVYPRRTTDASLDRFHVIQNGSSSIFLGGPDDNFSYTFKSLSWTKGIQINESFTSPLQECTDEWGNASSASGFHASNNNIEISKGGNIVFSTDNSMPHIYAIRTGVVSFAERSPDYLSVGESPYEEIKVLHTGLSTATTFILVEAEYSAPTHLVGYKVNFNGTTNPYSIQQGFSQGFELWVGHSLLDFYVDAAGRLIVKNRWFNESQAGQQIPTISFSYTAYLGLYN